MNDAKWDRRIRRANELASSYPFSAEGLRYYARVATFQKSLYGEIQKALADSPKISSDRPLRDELDLFLLLPKFPGFLSVIQQIAPAPLARPPPVWRRRAQRHGSTRLKTSGTEIQNWPRARKTRTARPPMQPQRLIPIECSRGFFFNRTLNILRITAKSPLWTELHRPARFAAASLPSAYCGAKATVRKSR